MYHFQASTEIGISLGSSAILRTPNKVRHPNSNLPPTPRRHHPTSTKLACLMPRAPRACEFQRSDVNPSVARPKCSHDLQCLFYASLQRGLRCRCQSANRLLSVGTTSSHYETARFALAFPRAPNCRTPIM